MAIVIEQLTHAYMAESALRFTALDGLTLTIEEGEFLGVIGHTGSGKSTFMQHLNGLLLPTGGSVLVDGFDTRDKKQRREALKRVGLVFQYPEYQLFEETVAEDVAFGPKNLGLSPEEARQRAVETLALVGLDPERFAEQSPFDLSGGEKRRTALAGILAMRPKYLALDEPLEMARALMSDPQLVMLDEPMAGLDPRGRRQILSLLDTLRRETGCTIIMVSHSMDDVARYATRLAVLNRGRLVMLGTPGEVFSRAEELEAMGLSVPQATSLARMLRERGIDLPAGIVRMDELRDALLERAGR